ncbi:MAG: hypothetical protein QGH40_05850, partial [bacterium]|nr:hypothetical protein [bacterium]
MVAMGISLVITGVVFQFLFAGHKSYEKGSERLDLVQAYSSVIERLKRELREATYDISVEGKHKLNFTKFELEDSNVKDKEATYLPKMGNSGFYALGEKITYQIKPSTRY